MYNRGVDGTGTDQIAQLACSSALDVKTKNSFGTITNAEIASNETQHSAIIKINKYVCDKMIYERR